MKPLIALLAALALAGCGLDAASSAATAASLKKQEIEQGKKTMTHAEQKIGDAVQQMNDSAARAGEEADKQ
ncbi:MAG: hypothetical protein ACREVQ_03500 [Burkholderiales bacterium]